MCLKTVPMENLRTNTRTQVKSTKIKKYMELLDPYLIQNITVTDGLCIYQFGDNKSQLS